MIYECICDFQVLGIERYDCSVSVHVGMNGLLLGTIRNKDGGNTRRHKLIRTIRGEEQYGKNFR